jgi:hypothetical protein
LSDLLDQTIDAWRRGSFVWGESDCLLSVGDYTHAARPDTPDIAARFRGTYDTEEGAMAHVLAYEGCDGLLDLFGLPRTENPIRGDIAVIYTGETEIGALCTGDTFVLRLERGTVEVNARFIDLIAAWSI